MDRKTLPCLQNASQHVVPVYLQQFPSYSNHNCKKIAIFTYPGLHFLFALLGTPCGNQAKRCVNKKTIQCLPNPRCMYLSSFNSFRVIRCLSQCVSPKIAIFTTFLFPWGNHAKCCMDGKRIRCLLIVSLHVPI